MKAPAICSVIAPEFIVQFAIQHYGFSTQTTCRLLKAGINHSYLINNGHDRFVLRVYYRSWRTELEIREELRLLNYLKENGIEVSYPIEDLDSKHIQYIDAVEGKRQAVLFSYAEGLSIKVPSEEVCYSLGLLMAKMHLLTIDMPLQRTCYDAETLAGWALKQAREFFDHGTPQMQYYERATERIFREFGLANHRSLRYGAVHIDLWYENMKVANESDICLFDFDNCGNGWLFLDIAYSIMLLFRNEPDKEEYRRKVKRFFEGYESITPISDEEKRLLPFGGLAIWLHYNGVHVYRFNDFSNLFLSEDFLEYWINTVDQWMAFNDVEI